MQKEVWLPVYGYDGFYEASNLGRVRRDIEAAARSLGVPGKEIKPSSDQAGYMRISLCKNGLVRSKPVHRIVLEAFCGPPPFEGAHAAHNDGDPSNNNLSNLRWATPAENQADIDRHNRRCKGEDVYGAVLREKEVKEIRSLISSGLRNRPISEKYGVSISTIHLIRHNKIWRHVQ